MKGRDPVSEASALTGPSRSLEPPTWGRYGYRHEEGEGDRQRQKTVRGDVPTLALVPPEGPPLRGSQPRSATSTSPNRRLAGPGRHLPRSASRGMVPTHDGESRDPTPLVPSLLGFLPRRVTYDPVRRVVSLTRQEDRTRSRGVTRWRKGKNRRKTE